MSSFDWSKQQEPHKTRREMILRAHPEVLKLRGHCPRTKYIVLFCVSLQIFMASLMPKCSWLVLVLSAYIVSGTINHMMTLAMHEITHELAFKNPLPNKIFGIITNLPLGVPAFASFQRYHLEHHRYQGEDGIDTDIPTDWEVRFFRTSFRKVLWIIMQPFFYAFRPLLTLPKVPGMWEMVNLAVVAAFDGVIFYLYGAKGVSYLLFGTLLGLGLHPLAGHFVAEHYCFIKGIETYSYYGALNILSFNVGYHNEHHDFLRIPGSRLPELRRIAPEFYDTLPHHTSWTATIWRYICDPNVGPFARVKRQPPAKRTTPKFQEKLKYN